MKSRTEWTQFWLNRQKGLQDRLLKHLSKGPKTSKELKSRMRLNKHTFLGVVRRAKEAGLIEELPRTAMQYPAQYRLRGSGLV